MTEIHARAPRVPCQKHGVKVIELQRAPKNSRISLLFRAFAIDVLKASKSVADARKILRVGWYRTQSIMAAAVKRGMAGRDDKKLAKTKRIRLKGMEHLSDEEEARRQGRHARGAPDRQGPGLRGDVRSSWKSVDRRFAEANFTFWHEQVVKSGIKPMIKVAKTLKRHLYGVLAWSDSMIYRQCLDRKIQCNPSKPQSHGQGIQEL